MYETELNLDQPKEGEHQYETLFGSSENSGGVQFYPRIIQNQGAHEDTKMACSRFGMCHAVNAQNNAVSKVDGMRFHEILGKDMWDIYLRSNPQAKREGATLQSVLKQFKENGYITGYSRINSVEDMKSSLDNFRPILTGSKNGDWNSVRNNHIYKIGKGPPHIFCILGYDDDNFYGLNSYGEKNGVFKIPHDLVDTLFSRYSISDSRDTEIFNNIP